MTNVSRRSKHLPPSELPGDTVIINGHQVATADITMLCLKGDHHRCAGRIRNVNQGSGDGWVYRPCRCPAAGHTTRHEPGADSGPDGDTT